MTNYRCGHCGKQIVPQKGKCLYRTCDTYVCNSNCQRERLKAISKLDPTLESPMAWTKEISINLQKPIKRKTSLIGLESLSMYAPGDIENDDELLPLIYPNDSYICEITPDLMLNNNYREEIKPYNIFTCCAAFVGVTLLLIVS